MANVNYDKYTLKNGEVRWGYRAYWGVDPKTGEQVRPEKRGFKTKSEARIHYMRTMEDLNNKTNKSAVKRLKFSQVYEEFLPYYRDSGVTEGTVVKFKLECNTHIIPHIGNMYIHEIDIDDCQKLVSKVRKRRKDFRKILGHARSIFRYAINKDYIKESPLDKITIRPAKIAYKKRRIATKDNFYTTEQMLDFLEFYEQNGRFHEFVYFRLLAFSGLRRGEALALYRSDLNKERKSLTINKTLTEGEHRNTILSEFTKTSDSDSDAYELFLDDYTFEVLAQLVDEAVTYDNYNNKLSILSSKFIFTSPRSDSHYQRSAPNGWLNAFWEKNKTALEKLGLRYISPHGFRHSQATMLYELGVDPKDAQHRLRHKNIKTTRDTYTHVSKNRERDTAVKLSSMETKRGKSRGKVIDIKDYFA